ncbi:hypothetical protein [Dokdonia sp. Asnod3-C12]|uniref:hypothetical protein n=1 Tax=Dokdonia sp. Asnod3-C12 TaxID=3160575 RepID=UPI0038707348
MILPKLPTDNLYKFISLFGLTLVVLYTFLNYKSDLELDKETAELSYEIDLINYEIDKANRERKDWINNVGDLCETKACNCKIEEKNDLNIKINFDQKECNSQDIFLEITRLQEFIDVDVIKLKSKMDIVNAKQNLIKRKEGNFKQQNSGLNWLLIFGIVMSFIGFILWYQKVQRYQDRILKEQASEFKSDIKSGEIDEPTNTKIISDKNLTKKE